MSKTPKDTDVMTVWVKVNEALREYLMCINGGSDILYPDTTGELWILVKSHLKMVPNDYKPELPQPKPGYIRIALGTSPGGLPVYNIQKCEKIHINYLFRNYLDEDSQRIIEHFLMKNFKTVYRAFMTGAVTTNTDACVKEAIYTFCDVHHLTMNSITYEMLRKDWYRYRKRTARGEPCQEIKEEII